MKIIGAEEALATNATRGKSNTAHYVFNNGSKQSVTIRNADEILSMVDGAVVERGTHDSLVDAGGVYSSQWTIQTGDMAGL